MVLAALNDLKCAYIEVINPLLSRKLFDCIKTLPANLRTDRTLLKRFLRQNDNGEAFAKNRAIAEYKDLLGSRRVVEFLARELGSARSDDMIGNESLKNVLNDLNIREHGGSVVTSRSIKAVVGQYIPERIRRMLRLPPAQMTLDSNQLAMRICIICKMHQMLCADREALKANTGMAIAQISPPLQVLSRSMPKDLSTYFS